MTPPPRGSTALSAVNTDTRTVAAGNLFVALRGERFDAHAFLAEAVTKGAAALVVSDATGGGDARRAGLRRERHARSR